MRNTEGDDCIEINIKELLDNKVSKDLFLARFTSLEERITYEAEARQKAIDKAETATSIALQKAYEDVQSRFNVQNEWRLAFKDRESAFVTREEFQNIADKQTFCISKADHEALIKQFETKIERTQSELATQIATVAAKVDRDNDRRYALWAGIIVAGIISLAALIGIKI